MKQEFDFENIGKRTPYSVPEGFFEDMQRKVMKETRRHQTAKRAKMVVMAVLAAAAVFAGVMLLPAGQNVTESQKGGQLAYQARTADSNRVDSGADDIITLTDASKPLTEAHHTSVSEENVAQSAEKTEPTEEWIENMSDEDLEMLCEISENDMFMAYEE